MQAHELEYQRSLALAMVGLRVTHQGQEGVVLSAEIVVYREAMIRVEFQAAGSCHARVAVLRPSEVEIVGDAPVVPPQGARRPAQYSALVDAIIDSAPFYAMGAGDLLDLAMACLDESGLPAASRGEVLEVLRRWMPEFK